MTEQEIKAIADTIARIGPSETRAAKWYCDLNSWTWPAALADLKPAQWDELPRRDVSTNRDQYTLLTPIMDALRRETTEAAIKTEWKKRVDRSFV